MIANYNLNGKLTYVIKFSIFFSIKSKSMVMVLVRHHFFINPRIFSLALGFFENQPEVPFASFVITFVV
jgi:hypothetical protein